MSTRRPTRHVSLTPELDAFVDERISSGHYRDASDLFRAALRMLIQEERRPLLKAGSSETLAKASGE